MDSVCAPAFFMPGVSPFGYLRIEAYLQLPAAFRSLSRPSSAPDAKAFPLCSSLLELLGSLICLNCCVHVLQLLWLNCFLYPFFRKDLFLSFFFFVPVRVLFFYSVFNDHRSCLHLTSRFPVRFSIRSLIPNKAYEKPYVFPLTSFTSTLKLLSLHKVLRSRFPLSAWDIFKSQLHAAVLR